MRWSHACLTSLSFIDVLICLVLPVNGIPLAGGGARLIAAHPPMVLHG